MAIPAGFGQLSVVLTGGGIVDEAIWTMGFDNDAGDTPAEAAEAWWTNLEALDYRDYLSSSVTVTEVRCKLGPDATGPAGFFAVGLSGTVGGQSAPPNLAFLVHKNTLLGGRRGRGRAYLGGLAEAQLDEGGNTQSATASGLQTALSGAAAAMLLGSKPLALIHADGGTPTPLDSLTVDVRLATQRRRMRR